MQKIYLTLFLAGFVALPTFATEEEALLGVAVDEKGITFQVKSSGCTKKEDFELQQQETFPVGLRLVRNQQDPCDQVVPYGTRITYSYEELLMSQGTEFQVKNQLAVVKVD